MDFAFIRPKKMHRRHLFLSALFSIYMFAYMVTLTYIDLGNTGVSAFSWQLTLHYIDQAVTAAAFLAFALLCRICRDEKGRIRLLGMANLAYTISVIALYFTQSALAYSILAILAAFSLGVLGGMVYACMALALPQISGIGKIMAIGASAAVVLQYVLQEHLDLMFGIPVMLSLAFSATLWLAVNKPWGGWEDAGLPSDKMPLESRNEIRKRLRILPLTVVALSVIGTFYDTQMMRLNVQTNYQEFDYYSWSRLFIIAGYILIGFIGDLKKQKYVPLATLCMAMFAVFNPILFGELESYHVNMCLYYIFLGVNIAYFNLMFWNIAPKTKWPALWAGMGRAISGLAEVFLTASHLADLPMYFIIGIDIVMFVVLVIAMACGNDLRIGSDAANRESGLEVGPAAMSPQERLKLYARRCSLTPRETEVLELLLTTDDDLQRIADSLYISRRMVQRYVSSIYEKTDTKTRLGLFQSYLNFTAE